MISKIRRAFSALRGYFRELGSLTPIAFVTAVLPIAGSSVIFYLFGHQIGFWLRDNWQFGTFVYFAGIVFFCGLSLLPTNIIGLIGGWAFGLWLGIVVLMSGIVCAASVSFLIHSKIAGERLTHVLENHRKAEAVYKALVGHGKVRTTFIIFLLRLSPAMPFALTNFLMASARVPLISFVIGTLFGMLPRSAAVVFVGSGLSELSLENPEEAWLFAFGVAATIFSIVLVTVISKRALNHLTRERADGVSPQ